MYDCSTIMKLLHPHLDGELDVKESIRVQTHLQECPYCRENFVAEKTFRDLVKQQVTPTPAPRFARQCVSAALSREAGRAARERRARRWSSRLVGMAAIAMGTLLVLAISLGLVDERGPAGLVKTAAAAHRAYVDDPSTLQIRSGDAKRVTAWLERRVHFDLNLPSDRVPNVELLGGRVTGSKTYPAAYLVYRMGKETVSLVMTPPQEVRLSGRDVIAFKNTLFHPSTVDGLHALQWSDSRHTYVLVSDQPDTVYRACVICHGSGESRDAISGFLDKI